MAGPISYVADGDGYQPGVCNIGPAEIARRQRAGDVEHVHEAESRAVDRRRSLEILGVSALGGSILAMLFALWPL